MSSDRSPSLGCERKDLDKNQCAGICDRLDAYRHGNDWHGIPIPTEAEIETGKKSESTSETQTDELCVICETRPAKTRGCCKPCYNAWYNGKIKHPVYGKYERTGHSTKHRADVATNKGGTLVSKTKDGHLRPVTELRLLGLAKILRKEMEDIKNNLHTRLCLLEGRINTGIELEGTLETKLEAGFEERIESLEADLIAHCHDSQGRAAITLDKHRATNEKRAEVP